MEQSVTCPSPPAAPQPGSDTAFSLVELLLVVAVIGILLALGLPAFNSVTRGMAVEQAGQQVADALLLTRENATTKNREAEIRFFKVPTPTGLHAIQGVQSWVVKDDMGSKIPISRPMLLPESAAISEKDNLSPILSGTNLSRGTMQIAGQDREYIAITFRIDGSLNQSTSVSDTFLTVVPLQEIDATSAPANYRSISVNPITGEIRTFRP